MRLDVDVIDFEDKHTGLKIVGSVIGCNNVHPGQGNSRHNEC